MAKIHSNLTSLIGNTPLLEVHNIENSENLKARFCRSMLIVSGMVKIAR